MTVKVIGIGNRLMMDDGIGVEVVQHIKKELLELGAEVFIGETDFQWCLQQIEEADCVFIIDAMVCQKTAGSVHLYQLNEVQTTGWSSLSQHHVSILDYLKLYFSQINGCLIGIEIMSVEFGFGLSLELQIKLPEISHNVYRLISEFLHIHTI